MPLNLVICGVVHLEDESPFLGAPKAGILQEIGKEFFALRGGGEFAVGNFGLGSALHPRLLVSVEASQHVCQVATVCRGFFVLDGGLICKSLLYAGVTLLRSLWWHGEIPTAEQSLPQAKLAEPQSLLKMRQYMN